MGTKHAARIRRSIEYARSIEAIWRPFDSFTRGMNYRHYQPKNELHAQAYRRTWKQLEYKREGIWTNVRPLRNV